MEFDIASKILHEYCASYIYFYVLVKWLSSRSHEFHCIGWLALFSLVV